MSNAPRDENRVPAMLVEDADNPGEVLPLSNLSIGGKPAQYTKISATSQVKSGAGILYGVIISSHSSASLIIWDSLSSSGAAVTGAYSPPSGSSIITFPKPIQMDIGIRFQLSAGSINATVIWE